jgi:hypothetical protein
MSFFFLIQICTGVPGLPPQRKKRVWVNVTILILGKKALIEKRHPKLDQSELSTIKVG